jgi:ribosome biogenesis GTPase
VRPPPLPNLELLALSSSSGLIRARVCGVAHGKVSLLEGPGVPASAAIGGALRHAARAGAALPVVGDWVEVDPARRVVRSVLPRSGGIARSFGTGPSTPQMLAANVDVVLVVGGLDGDHNLRRLERFVALAGDAGATPVVLLSKADLVEDVEGVVASVAASLGGRVPVLAVSVRSGLGLDALATWLTPGTVVALLGSSGVGKTSLRNALVGVGVAPSATAPVRPGDDRGRHTTTARELVELPGGALLVDTPGLRLPRLWDQGVGLATAFPDVEALAARCRFADCAHDGEPGCAVAEAIADGQLAPERLAALRQLEREGAWLASRRDERARSERERVSRKLHREQERVQAERGAWQGHER